MRLTVSTTVPTANSGGTLQVGIAILFHKMTFTTVPNKFPRILRGMVARVSARQFALADLGYVDRASMLIFLKIGEFGIRQPDIGALMESAETLTLPHFHRVWILWKTQLYGRWTG
jgi:hypothetical protein